VELDETRSRTLSSLSIHTYTFVHRRALLVCVADDDVERAEKVHSNYNCLLKQAWFFLEKKLAFQLFDFNSNGVFFCTQNSKNLTQSRQIRSISIPGIRGWRQFVLRVENKLVRLSMSTSYSIGFYFNFCTVITIYIFYGAVDVLK